MKLALIFLTLLASLSFWFGAQGTPAVTCRGKPLPITMLPGPKLTGPALPLRFGGTRHFPYLQLLSNNALRLTIKSADEFSNFWKQLNVRIPPDQSAPPPEIDFSKVMVVVAAMGERPSSGHWVIIDGACEVGGQIEVFVSNIDDASCAGVLPVVTYPADAVLLPRTDLPVVFRETQVSCTQWQKLHNRLK